MSVLSAYMPDYEPMKINIVDAAIQYDCPYTDEQYILDIRNALLVPPMQNNLIPPLRDEGGRSVCQGHTQDSGRRPQQRGSLDIFP
jgi:hypothetical protein